MRRVLENNGSASPKFDANEPERSFFVSELFIHPSFLDDKGEGGPIGGSIKLTDRQKEILELIIDNKVQEREIVERKSNIMFFMREELNNYHIQLETKIEESQEEKKAYLPEEIYQEMVKKNPNIKKLRDELDLELDY